MGLRRSGPEVAGLNSSSRGAQDLLGGWQILPAKFVLQLAGTELINGGRICNSHAGQEILASIFMEHHDRVWRSFLCCGWQSECEDRELGIAIGNRQHPTFFISELQSDIAGGYDDISNRELEWDLSGDLLGLAELSYGDQWNEQKHQCGNPFYVFHTAPPWNDCIVTPNCRHVHGAHLKLYQLI